MKTKIFLCTMLAFVMSLPASVLSQERQRGRSEQMMAQLGLTPEQETRLRELHRQTSPERREQNRKINEVREKINAEILKEKPSQKALENYAVQMGNLHKQINVLSIDHLLKVKAILTPEQFKKFTETAPMGDPGAHSRGPRGERSEGTPGGEGRMRENRGKDPELENLENLMRRQRDNINR